jgi:hypothetical protein
MPQGFALESASSAEVIAAYSTAQTPVPAVAESPGWHVLGEFHLPKSTAARLDAIALVSAEGLTCRARLFDRTAAAVVSGAVVSITSLTSVRALSGVVQLIGNHRYQVQAECTGDTGDDQFAVVHTATITD